MNEAVLNFTLRELAEAAPYGDPALGPLVARELWRAYPCTDYFGSTLFTALAAVKAALAGERPEGAGVLRVVLTLPKPAKVGTALWVPEVRV